MAPFLEDSFVVLKGLTGSGRWMGLNDRYRHGPEQLSQDAQLVLSLALTYTSGNVPSAAGLYEAQRDQAKALGQRYMGLVRVKKALQELSARGFYGIRRVSAGRDMIVTLRSYSNKPYEHLQELEARPKDELVAKYFPGDTKRKTRRAEPAASDFSENTEGDHETESSQEVAMTNIEPGDNQAGQSETMTVTVRDHHQESASWGKGPFAPSLRTVTISASCAVCGRRRGRPQGHNQHEDGVSFRVDVWQNPCGHLDMYHDVIAEADKMLQQAA